MSNVLVVYKKSTYELYRHSPDKKTKTYALTNPEVLRSHQMQQQTLDAVLGELNRAGYAVTTRYRAHLCNEDFRDKEYGFVVGGDGTVLDVAHYVDDAAVPLMGINSDPHPNGSIGFYSYCSAKDFAKVLADIKTAPQTSFNRLKVLLNGKRLPELVLNDLHITHRNSSAMVRYTLVADGQQVLNNADSLRLRSNGLLICAAGGSTAWMYQEGGVVMPLDSKQMQYHERGIRNTPFWFAEKIEVESLTREGSIDMDGEHIRYQFTLGDKIVVRSGNPLTIIGEFEEKRKKYVKDVVPRKLVE